MKHAWNTGAFYTVAGQRIAAECVGEDYKDARIIFVDIDRMIDGEFPVVRLPRDTYALERLTQTAYDFGNYQNPRDWERTRDLSKWCMENAPMRRSR